MRAAIYARVSTYDQDCKMQLSELWEYAKRQGWEFVDYIEKASGKAGSRRPALDQLMHDARTRKIDVVIVWKLDRFGRSLQEFVTRVVELDQAGVRFIAPSQGIDTNQQNPASKLLMNILMSMAEFERDLIRERTKAGLAQAKKAGKILGRRRAVFDRSKARRLKAQGLSIRAIAQKLGVKRSTLADAFKAA